MLYSCISGSSGIPEAVAALVRTGVVCHTRLLAQAADDAVVSRELSREC